MPFKPDGHGKYTSPSGRKFTQAQVKLYYATGGTFKKGVHNKKVVPDMHGLKNATTFKGTK